MEGADPYAVALEQALESKRAQLDATLLPAMREHFRLFLTTFEGPYNVLLRKGLIRKDPYKFEERLSEIRIPSREPFAPTALDEQMGIRLSQYHSQIDFLVNYYEFNVAFLTLGRLKQVTALVRYLNFGNLVETSPNANDSGLALLFARAIKASDSVVAGVVKNGVTHLAELSRRILKGIAEVVLYHRERYKLDLRSSVIRGLDQAQSASEQDGMLAALKRAAHAASFPVYADLIVEVLAEDHPPREELRAKVLGRLKVEEAKREKPAATGPAPREILLDAVRALAATEPAVRSALKAIRESEELVARAPVTFAERVFRFFARTAGAGKADEKRYEIEFLDESRGSSKMEQIVWLAFLDEVTAKARTLQALATRNSPAIQRVEAASDDRVFELLSKLCSETMRLTRRMEGLSALFRSQVPPMHRSRLQGVHGDLAIVRNAVARANRQKHEYVARQEEEEQFRKLGIAPPSSDAAR
jgi:hypothetical protein